MKIYIFVDMEGISGISGSEFVMEGQPRFSEGRRYYTQEVNACAAACFKAGAKDVIVRDGHSSGRHLFWDQLDPRLEVIQGHSGACRFPGLTTCAGLILLGYHAMAGTPGALLEHTYSSATIQNMWLNGRKVGEIGIDAAIAGEQGVPAILVTGDGAACREARAWIPGVQTCAVKTGLGTQGARLLSQTEAHKRIGAAVEAAIQRIGRIKPLKVKRPVVMRREVVERAGIPSAARQDIRVLDARTYEVTAPSVEKALFAM